MWKHHAEGEQGGGSQDERVSFGEADSLEDEARILGTRTGMGGVKLSGKRWEESEVTMGLPHCTAPSRLLPTQCNAFRLLLAVTTARAVAQHESSNSPHLLAFRHGHLKSPIHYSKQDECLCTSLVPLSPIAVASVASHEDCSFLNDDRPLFPNAAVLPNRCVEHS